MQQSAASAPKPNSSSFAGFLAALAAPDSASAGRPPAWNDAGLEDDIATLSYERALRTHARYRPADRCDDSPTQKLSSAPIGSREPSPAFEDTMAETTIPPASQRANDEIVPEFTETHPSTADSNLKTASITIRLSHAECAQLRKRAADAGLTVSAYLRSCTFEAESLRAQVKEALAQLRTGEPREKVHDPAPIKRSWLHWPMRSGSRARAC